MFRRETAYWYIMLPAKIQQAFQPPHTEVKTGKDQECA